MAQIKDIYKKLGSYKYVLLVIAVGLILLLWPNAPPEDIMSSDSALQTDPGTLEQQLEEVLSKIDGVGRVSVLLTRKTDIEVQYVYDTESTDRKQWDGGVLSSSETDIKSAVVMQGDSAGGERPLVKNRIYPVYQGALIVCDGALNSDTRMKVAEAVAALTNLGYDRITIVKMKP